MLEMWRGFIIIVLCLFCFMICLLFMISVFILFQFYVHIFIFCISFMEIKKCQFSTLYVNYYKSLNMLNKLVTQ